MPNKQTQRFLNRKSVKRILQDTTLTDIHYMRLNNFFDYYISPKNVECMLDTIANFVLYDLNNYKGRYRRLKGIPGTTKYTQLLRYGKKEFLKIYNKQTSNKKKGFKNCIEYWLDKGYSEEESKIQVNQIQRERNKLSVEKIKGTSEYSCRSLSYWLKQGFTEEESKQKVTEIQTTNGLSWYINKYGIDDGPMLYQSRITKWQQTLTDKTIEEMDVINLKKSHSVDGQIARGHSVAEARIKYDQYCEKMKAKPRQRFSKISQHLFEILDNLITGTTYYEIKNYEYLINGLRVDFFHKESGTVIEFHGDFFHRNPLVYKADFKSFGYTSEEKWLLDKNREERIRTSNLVSNLIIVWESNYRLNPDTVISECVEHIGEEYVY